MGEEVSIRGSERITSWVNQGGKVWMVELDNAFFGAFNPFNQQVSGSWLYYGEHHHLGDVYLNGAVYHEKQSIDEVEAEPGTWHVTVDASTTRIRANFGSANPNDHPGQPHPPGTDHPGRPRRDLARLGRPEYAGDRQSRP